MIEYECKELKFLKKVGKLNKRPIWTSYITSINIFGIILAINYERWKLLKLNLDIKIIKYFHLK